MCEALQMRSPSSPQSTASTIFSKCQQGSEYLQDLRASLATRRLQDAVGEASANTLFILAASPQIQRKALCGNQVCEAGERYAPPGTTGKGASHSVPPTFPSIQHTTDSSLQRPCEHPLST